MKYSFCPFSPYLNQNILKQVLKLVLQIFFETSPTLNLSEIESTF